MSKTTFVLMFVVALVADGASFFITLIPGIGQILNPVFGFIVALTFWFWFAWIGLGWHGVWGSGASAAVEIVPFLQALPPFTLVVVVIYLKNKKKNVPIAGKVVGSISKKGSESKALRRAA